MLRALWKITALVLLVLTGSLGLWIYQERFSASLEVARLERRNEALQQVVKRLGDEKRVAELLVTEQKADTSGLENTTLMGSDGCSDATYTDIGGDATNGVFLSGPDLTAFTGGDFYKNEFLPAYVAQFGSNPISVFHAHAYDAMNVLFDAITAAAVQNSDGSLSIPRTALRDAVQATNGYQGIIGTITCTPLGDCATSVTIGVYEVPNVGFLDPSAKPVFTETKTLDEVA